MAQKGRDFVLKVGTAAAGTVLAAMRTTSFSINGEMVDITTKDDNGWRKLLDGAGVSSMQIQASGILSGAASHFTLMQAVGSRTIATYSVVFDGGDTIEGSFQPTSFEASGEHNGVQTYTLTLESSGQPTFSAAT